MLRHFRRDRLFHTVIVLLLALGIGANTLVFSLVNELLLKPLPVRDPGNLFLVERVRTKQVRPDSYYHYEHLDAVQRNPQVAAAIAEQFLDQRGLVRMSAGGAVRLVTAQIVSPNYFRELGLRAYLGRVLDEADAAAQANPPAVLSYQFWQSQFGGDAEIVGRTIRLKDIPFVVAGVMPREFHSIDLDRAPDVRIPLSMLKPLFGDDPEARPYFQILVRTAKGVSATRAADALMPAVRQMDEQIERDNAARAHLKPQELEQLLRDLSFRVVLEPVKHGVSRMRTQFTQALWLLLGGVLLLLVSVCANVAGLLLARSGERRKEMGIRLAVGAGRWRIVRQVLGENLLLAVPGAALGAAAAWLFTPALVGLLPPVRDLGQFGSPQLLVVRPDLRVLAFTIGATLLCVLAAGLIPAWRASRVDLLSELKAVRGAMRRGAGVTPVAIQVAFCTVLLAGSGLMLRTFRNLDRLDAGFDREHVIEFTLDPLDAGYTTAQSSAFFKELRRRVAELPGVRAAAYASRGVMRTIGIKMTVAPEGVILPKDTFLNTSENMVTPGYFGTMGIRMAAGRDLAPADAGVQPAPVVVNQAFADAFFPRQNPIGRRLANSSDGATGRPNRTIVGVVATAKYRSMRETDPPTIYDLLDESQRQTFSPLLYIRTYGAPAGIAASVRQTLGSLDAGVPLLEVLTLDEEVRTSLWQERLVALLSAFFGIASVMLAAIGLYGALAWSVTRRRRELGIRLAVGARIRHILETVCSPMALAVGCGLAAGLVGSAALLRVAQSLLFGVRAVDLASYVGAVGVVVLCALSGAALPARRAVRIDPSRALREE
jgi:predicted permease